MIVPSRNKNRSKTSKKQSDNEDVNRESQEHTKKLDTIFIGVNSFKDGKLDFI